VLEAGEIIAKDRDAGKLILKASMVLHGSWSQWREISNGMVTLKKS
jgi:hypothetical protein